MRQISEAAVGGGQPFGWIYQTSEHRLLIPYDVLQGSGQKRLDLKSRPALLATPMLLCKAVF